MRVCLLPLGLKLRSVETPIKRLFEKLGRHGPEARSRTAAVNRVWIAHWAVREEARAR